MIHKLLSLVKGRRTIRFEMFWASALSYSIALLLLGIVGSFVNRLGIAQQIWYVVPTAFVVGFIVTFLLLTRRTIRYLHTLTEGLEKMSDGELGYRVPILRKDELGQVAMHINKMAEKLERQIQKERDAEKAKMDLITGVSHDLRTPLTSMIGYLDLLITKAFLNQQEHERFLQNTYSKAMHLKKLIDDLFEYTRLTSGSVTTNLKPTDVRELLNQLLFEFEPIAGEYGATLARDMVQAPVVAEIDSELRVRVVDNLLMNALKHSHKPGVIRVSLTTDESHVYLAVENQGTPITKEQEQKLFSRFYKIDPSRHIDEIQTGAGLGLSIAEQIAGLHGGTLRLKHDAGLFVFTLAIPLRKK